MWHEPLNRKYSYNIELEPGNLLIVLCWLRTCQYRVDCTVHLEKSTGDRILYYDVAAVHSSFISFGQWQALLM